MQKPRLLLRPPKSKGTGIAAGVLFSQAAVGGVEAVLAVLILFEVVAKVLVERVPVICC